jgi:hypothetical protein
MSYSGESGRKADASTIVDAINSARDDIGVGQLEGDKNRTLKWDSVNDRTRMRDRLDGTTDESILPGFGPDGFGHNARDDCGDPHPFICDSCGHSVEFGRTCGQSVCSRCGVAWVRDLSIKKAAKVRRLRKEKHQHTPANEHQKIHHVIISTPLSWWYDLAKSGCGLSEAQDLTKDVVKDILEELRAQGVLIRHSFRGANDDGTIASESDDKGEWKERLNSGRDWFGDVRDEVAFKPHFHAVVVSDMVRVDTDRIEEKTGWVLHRIQNDDGVSLEDDGAMARALTYSLSHADIDVRRDGHNRSAVWEVGAFQGDPFKSSSRFRARPSDLEWSDVVVRRHAEKVLGLRSGTTECGQQLPGVDDPDELARKIIEELYPKHDRNDRDVDADAVLGHVIEGNISVNVSTTSGGGGNVTVSDAFGETVGPGGLGGSPSDLPDSPGGTASGAAVRAVDVDDRDVVDDVQEDDHDHGDDCECGSSVDDTCDGSLIPLGEARDRGLLEDDDWCRAAPFVDEAREADRDAPEDLERWKAESPGKTVAGIG